MMEWTDRHCRSYLRLWSPNVLLYTEMVVAQAIIKGDTQRLLGFDQAEHPLALQLGGSEPQLLARAARMAMDFGYDEINLNVGCPSDRVQKAVFGACLMREPKRVADCVAAMKAVVNVPVTVKCRIGVDDEEGYEFLARFVEPVVAAGCDAFIVHARKAILGGLSPKENREIPPLCYPVVWQLKKAYPQLPIVLNGGLKTAEQTAPHWPHVDGVMIGREAYHRPAVLSELAVACGLQIAPTDPEAVYDRWIEYVAGWLARGERLAAMSRHVLGHYTGRPGARAFRRTLSMAAHRPDAGVPLLREARRAASESQAA
jgi:tRNA-dihydrouridine synthase A